MKLVVTEKPSVAKSIASVIGATTAKQGYFKGNGYYVSWCLGHLVALCEPDEYDEIYRKWNIDTLPIIPQKWKYKVLSSSKSQYNILKSLMEQDDVTELIEATDAGREGELIFRLVYYKAKCKKPFQRLWISSMEDKSIIDGFNNLVSGSDFDNLYMAALCRQRADWLVGMNGTRLFTCQYGNGNKLSVGRVQTPTLKIIVDRDAEISNFNSTQYFLTHITTENGIEAVSSPLTKIDAEQLAAACLNSQALIADVEINESKKLPPKLYDLTSLQKDANKILGYTAEQTLTYLQELYEKKLVTYPRTDSKYLTEDMSATAANIISVLANKFLPAYDDVNTNLHNVKQILNSSKVTDHHAIIPTAEIAADNGAFDRLPGNYKKLYYLIMIELFEATYTNYVYESTKIKITCNNYDFSANGTTVKDLGWYKFKDMFKDMLKDLMFNSKSKSDNYEKVLPRVVTGQSFNIVESNFDENWTKPKAHYTEATILSEMERAGAKDMNDDVERKGLGTPATRAAIIEKLIKDGYVIREKNHLVSTEKGSNLIKIMPEIIKLPLMTVKWENQLSDVRDGKLSFDEFMTDIEGIVKLWVSENKEKNQEYSKLFKLSKGDKEIIGVCPKCGGNVYENSKGFCCENRDFGLYKENKYFAALRKKITPTIAKQLFTKGRVHLSDLYSKKKDSTFSATIVMTVNGNYPNFSMEFDNTR